MRKYFRPILLLAAILEFHIPNMMSQVVNPDSCSKRLQDYMKEFPSSDLCDVYKFCFQDVFGPAHLAIDSSSAVKSIEIELEKSKTLGGPDYQYTGCECNYVRVNLSLVKKGILTASLLASCLARSVNPPHPMSVEEWKYRWGELENILFNMKPSPGHFTLDSESIESLLDRGGYAVHHSYSFNSTYNFHYRIIRRDIFESEILPLIPKGKHK